MRKVLAAAAFAGAMALAQTADARDNVRIVGSSTVYPFTVAVINEMEKSKGLDIDIKSTGTGGGFLLFCTGGGDTWPDLTGASRPMKDYEKKRCERNGAGAITEIKIGYDGIVVANAANGPAVAFTREDLFKALAARTADGHRLVVNRSAKWSDVNPKLPDAEIAVIGPPASSGTRDAFEGFVMRVGCAKAINLDDIDAEEHEELCSTIRKEPHYVEGGEDDEVIVQQLAKARSKFGVFGFSFAVNNPERVKANSIDGVMPSVATIKNGSYPLARPLFLYVKNERLKALPALRQFLAAYVSDAAIGPGGYLAKRGLVPLSDEMRAETAAKIKALPGS